ncbi:MAG: hypothetical protein ABI147_05330 [Acidobacteriaceae bacterium]
MLNENQITSIWERQIAAEVRALYFADLANKYTKQKQFISGASLFLASGAAATLIGKSPSWVPILLSIITALLSAYSVARGLDGSTRTMAKFQFAWSELAAGYEALWNSTYGEDANSQLGLLVARENDLSSQTSTDAPNDQKRLEYWQEQVFKQHHLVGA